MCVCGLNKNHCFVDCLKLSIINLQNPAPGRCFTLVTALISSHLELLRSLRITKNHLHYNHSYVCVFIYIYTRAAKNTSTNLVSWGKLMKHRLKRMCLKMVVYGIPIK